jgi:hypothetical protein
VVDCKSVGSGEPALIYLGRYLYRGVIAEKDIVACGDGQVGFRYRNAKTGRMEQRTVSGAEFPVAGPAACAAQGLSPCAQLRLSASELQAADRLAAPAAQVRSGPVAGLGQGTGADSVFACCGAVMVIVKTRIRSVSEAACRSPLSSRGLLTM